MNMAAATRPYITIEKKKPAKQKPGGPPVPKGMSHADYLKMCAKMGK
jgi:hypothetical protein